MSAGEDTIKCAKTQINFKEISTIGEHKIILADPENSFIFVNTKKKQTKLQTKKLETKSNTSMQNEKIAVPTVKLASPAIPKPINEPINTNEIKPPSQSNSAIKITDEEKTNSVQTKTPIKAEIPSKENEEEKKLTPIASQSSPRKVIPPSLDKSIELNPEFFMFCLKRKKFAEYYFEIGISNIIKQAKSIPKKSNHR